MSELTTIARPYAKAAFEYAVEAKDIDKWLSMLFFAGEVAKDQTVLEYLTGDASVEQSQEIFLTVCGEQIDEKCQNFIKVMAENRRLLMLPQVFEQFIELKAEFDKEISVDVTSAIKLSVEQETTISAALAKRLARKVKLNCKVDDDIISGLIIKAGDSVIDGSLKGKLSDLATSLQS